MHVYKRTLSSNGESGRTQVEVMFRASKGTGLSEPHQLPVFACKIHLAAASQTQTNALADTARATYRHSVPTTLHTKTMDIACILDLLLNVSAATDRRLGHHSHTLIDTGCGVWYVSGGWRGSKIETLISQISDKYLILLFLNRV